MDYRTWIMAELYGKTLTMTQLKNKLRENAHARDERFSAKKFAGALDDLQTTGRIRIFMRVNLESNRGAPFRLCVQRTVS